MMIPNGGFGTPPMINPPEGNPGIGPNTGFGPPQQLNTGLFAAPNPVPSSNNSGGILTPGGQIQGTPPSMIAMPSGNVMLIVIGIIAIWILSHS